MAYEWVASGMRGLRLSRAGFLGVSPAIVGPATYRRPHCNAATSSLPTAPSVSILLRKVDGRHNGRGLATLGAVRRPSGTVHRRNTREVQLRRMHSAFAPPCSSGLAGVGKANLGGRHPSSLVTWSRSRFSTSTDTTLKKPKKSSGDEGDDDVPLLAEADVAEVVEVKEPTKEEPRHAHIEMPSIIDVGVQTDASRVVCTCGDLLLFRERQPLLASFAQSSSLGSRVHEVRKVERRLVRRKHGLHAYLV